MIQDGPYMRITSLQLTGDPFFNKVIYTPTRLVVEGNQYEKGYW